MISREYTCNRSFWRVALRFCKLKVRRFTCLWPHLVILISAASHSLNVNYWCYLIILRSSTSFDLSFTKQASPSSIFQDWSWVLFQYHARSEWHLLLISLSTHHPRCFGYGALRATRTHKGISLSVISSFFHNTWTALASNSSMLRFIVFKLKLADMLVIFLNQFHSPLLQAVFLLLEAIDIVLV
jgi:hypothetical protein